MSTPAKIIELRELLSQRFPRVRAGLGRPVETTSWPTGVPALDALLGGGLPRGEMTELVGAGPGSGSAQVLHALLRRAAADGRFLALVDGADSFDVDAVEPDVLARLLWVRCDDAGQSLKAADLLLRDRNFPLVVVDLKLNPPAQLRKISASVWHRFRRLLEHNGTTALIITPTPFVGGVAARVRVESQLTTSALAEAPVDVLASLRFELLRATEVRDANHAARTA